MSACEKCWADSRELYGPGGYMRLLEERKANPCTPEQQAGPDARECPWCGRKTLHQHTGEPMCGCPRSPREAMPTHSFAVTQGDSGG